MTVDLGFDLDFFKSEESKLVRALESVTTPRISIINELLRQENSLSVVTDVNWNPIAVISENPGAHEADFSSPHYMILLPQQQNGITVPSLFPMVHKKHKGRTIDHTIQTVGASKAFYLVSRNGNILGVDYFQSGPSSTTEIILNMKDFLGSTSVEIVDMTKMPTMCNEEKITSFFVYFSPKKGKCEIGGYFYNYHENKDTELLVDRYLELYSKLDGKK